MIKEIAFDFAGVIAPGPLSKWKAENIHDDQKRLENYKKASISWDLGKLNEEEFYQVVGKLTETPPEEVWENFYENSSYHQEVIDLIKDLKEGHGILLFSNNFAPLLRRVLDHHDISVLFDEILISSEYGVKKPDQEFYHLLLEKSGVAPNEIIFIDDTKENVETGNALGITSLHFTDIDSLKKELSSLGVNV